jgi:DNA-binding MarR family transcriptional regulator
MDDDRIARIMAQWKSERPDLEAADLVNMGLVGRVQRFAAELRPRLDATHAENGLAGESFDVLATLRRFGEPHEMTPTQLYTHLMLSSGAMTNRIDRLEADGFVERRADPNDRRGTLVHLTKKGKALIDRALLPHVKNEARILSMLSADEKRQLNDLLRKILIALES